jgi:hypothetical protein
MTGTGIRLSTVEVAKVLGDVVAPNFFSEAVHQSFGDRARDFTIAYGATLK